MQDPLDLDRLPSGIFTPPTDEELQEAEKDDEELKVEIKSAELQRYLNDTKDRGWLAKWTSYIVSSWLFLVIVILCTNKWLCLSEPVLLMLLGTTTLNILGLSFIVLRGHFNSSKSEQQ